MIPALGIFTMLGVILYSSKTAQIIGGLWLVLGVLIILINRIRVKK